MAPDDEATGGGPEAAEEMANKAKDDAVQEDSPGVEPDEDGGTGDGD